MRNTDNSPRIIAGIVKNKKLVSPRGLNTKPLLVTIKKSLFDILSPKIPGSVFLDLYAGIGNVGIEALSRGAKETVFIDNSAECINIIKENLKNCGFTPLENATDSCRWYKSLLFNGSIKPPSSFVRELSSLTGFAETAQVFLADILKKLPKLNKKFDLIFIGPPYKLSLLKTTLNIIEENDLLKEDGWIIGQHHFKEPVPEETSVFVMFRQKKYGDTRLSFFKKRRRN